MAYEVVYDEEDVLKSGRTRPGLYSLSRRFDSKQSFTWLSRLTGNGVLDDAWRVATAFLAKLMYDDDEVYPPAALHPGLRKLLEYYRRELRPLAEKLRLILVTYDEYIAVFREVLRRLREKRDVKPIIHALSGISDLAYLAETLHAGKGRDWAVRTLLRGGVDKRRLEIARKVSVVARMVGRIVTNKLEKLRKTGPGYEPAYVGGMEDATELARATPLAYGLLATSYGRIALLDGSLPVIKTYRVGSKGLWRPNSLGVVIDASGSMAGDEIIVATGIGIALFASLRPRHRRLAFFDTTFKEVHDPNQFLDYLLTISPGGGTYIAGAVEAARRSWGDDVDIVVVTDGRDSPPEPRENVRYVIITRDSWESYGWKKRGDAWLIEYKDDKIHVVIK